MKHFKLFFILTSVFLISSCKFQIVKKGSGNPDGYKITYHSQYGIAPASIYVPKKSVLEDEQLPDYEITGCEFKGWFLQGDESEKIIESGEFIVTKDIDLEASLTPKNILLTYLPNGAEGELSEEEILFGEEFTVAENPYTTPFDMKFAYWNTRRDGRGTSYIPGETHKMTGYDLYLYAYWIESDSYSIVYKNCEGADNSVNPVEYRKSDAVELLPLEKTGYVFGGWYLAEDFSGEQITGWDAESRKGYVIIYAKWIPESRTVTYKAGNGLGEDLVIDVNYDEVIELPEIMFKTPKNKKGWSWKINGNEYFPGDEYGPVQEDTEFTAEYVYLKSGDTAKKYIEIAGQQFDRTEEVCVVAPLSIYEIDGSDAVWASYIWEGDHNDFKGAFIDGRKISLSPFAVSKYMVTRELFKAVFGRIPSGDTNLFEGNENYLPVGGISWYASIAFCNKLTLLTGGAEEDLAYYIEGINWSELTYDDIPTSNDTVWDAAVCDIRKPGYRILTEAEWEFAARGGDTTKAEWNYAFPGFNASKVLTREDEAEGYANNIASKTQGLNNWVLLSDDVTKDYAWLMNNSDNRCYEVGLKKPNSLGIYDMAGSLWEWVWDLYSTSPADADSLYEINGRVKNPMGPEAGLYRIRKGCNFNSTLGYAFKASSGFRGDRMEEYKANPNSGLRIGRSLVE